MKRLGSATLVALLAALAIVLLPAHTRTQVSTLLLGNNSGTARPFSVTSTGALNVVLSASSSGFSWAFGTLANDAQAIQSSATMGSVPTGALSVYSFSTTGAGSASQNVIGLLSSLLAGYTGSSNTYALRGANTTVGSGLNHGVEGTAVSATTGINIGVSGSATTGTKNVGLWASSASVAASALIPFTGSVGGIAGVFHNGTNTDDLIAGIDCTTSCVEVFRLKDNGDVDIRSATGDVGLNVDFTATSGGGNMRLVLNGGTNASFGSFNNIPWSLVANGTTYYTLSTAGVLTNIATAISRASGFGTNNDGAFVTGSTPEAWDFDIGTGGSPTSGVFTLPTAPHGWTCWVVDATTGASSFTTRQTAYTTTSVTFTTTVAWTAGDNLFGGCKSF